MGLQQDLWRAAYWLEEHGKDRVQDASALLKEALDLLRQYKAAPALQAEVRCIRHTQATRQGAGPWDSDADSTDAKIAQLEGQLAQMEVLCDLYVTCHLHGCHMGISGANVSKLQFASYTAKLLLLLAVTQCPFMLCRFLVYRLL